MYYCYQSKMSLHYGSSQWSCPSRIGSVDNMNSDIQVHQSHEVCCRRKLQFIAEIATELKKNRKISENKCIRN